MMNCIHKLLNVGNWIMNEIREHNAVAWAVVILGITLMILIAFM